MAEIARNSTKYMPSEQEEFLKDIIPQDENPLDPKPEEPILPEKDEESDEQKEEKRLKNRAERRKDKKYEEALGMIEELNHRVKVLSETDKFQKEAGDDHLKEVEAIFGTATPEAKRATEILKGALVGMKESAKQELIAEWETRSQNESQQEKEAEKTLDEILETVDEDYGIDIDDEVDRRGFLTMLQKVSPKDKDGNIIEYADADEVAQLYLMRKKNAMGTSRAKEISSRSMTPSGASQPSRIQQTAEEKFLRDEGIISW